MVNHLTPGRGMHPVAGMATSFALIKQGFGIALCVVVLSLPSFLDAAGSLAPDLLIVNATIHTLDTNQPLADAVAVVGNRIVSVGESAALHSLAGPRTRVIDACGRLVLPGFNDAHVHWLSGGFSIANVDLRDAKSPEEFARRLGDYAKTLPAGRWIQGGDWDHENWPGAPLPTRQMIDSVTPENPVFVSRLDGHMALANSLALQMAGVTKESGDVPGGVIVRDSDTGEPTGILKDSAMGMVERIIPSPSEEEKYAAAVAATAHAAKLGVTSVQDMSAGTDIGLYQTQLERGELKTRIYAVRSVQSWETLARTGIRAPFGNDMLRIGGLKGFCDGSLGSSTALFFEPYNDAPDTCGLFFDQMLPEGAMLQRVLGADQAGLQVMIHAIGDRANATILDLFAEVAEQNGARDRRFRIEHAQHLRREDIARFGRQRVIASMQPYHAADDGRWCDKRIGPERSKGTYAFRSLLDSGAVLAFGSDWTVAPLNPLEGIKAAVTRQTLDRKHPDGWIPEEKITVEEAVCGYTVGAAYAEFTETEKGTVTPGKLADMVILDRDIFEIDPALIDEAKVVMTILGGRVIYEAVGF